MISNYREFFPRMIDDLPGCNQDRIMINALRDAGREFCRRTEAWKYEIPAINIVANQQEYDLTDEIEYDATVLRIEWVKTGTTTADPIPDSYFTLEDDVILKFQTSVIPSAALTSGLVIKVALLPHMNSDELAEWFMEKWGEAIVGKAMFDLLKQEGKPWLNVARAEKYLMDYRRGLCNATAENTRGFKPGPDYVYG